LKQPASPDDSAPRLSADQIVARDPAVGRAMQVQAALAVESLTGSAHDPAAGTRAVAGERAIVAGSSMPTAGNAPQGAPDMNAGLVRGLNAMVNHSGGVMTMRLDPPELGQVRVQMTIAQGTVTAHFQPATAEAQALLERSLPALRAALEAHGLAAERLTVQSAPSAPPVREQAHDQPAHERHHQDAGGGESRGRRDGAPHDRRHHATWQSAPFELQTASRRALQGAIQ
jgi:flagellar hook-length control protein FliK